MTETRNPKGMRRSMIHHLLSGMTYQRARISGPHQLHKTSKALILRCTPASEAAEKTGRLSVCDDARLHILEELLALQVPDRLQHSLCNGKRVPGAWDLPAQAMD